MANIYKADFYSNVGNNYYLLFSKPFQLGVVTDSDEGGKQTQNNAPEVFLNIRIFLLFSLTKKGKVSWLRKAKKDTWQTYFKGAHHNNKIL